MALGSPRPVGRRQATRPGRAYGGRRAPTTPASCPHCRARRRQAAAERSRRRAVRTAAPARRRPTAPPPGPPPRARRLPRFRLGMVKWVLLLWLVFLVTVPLWAWTKVEKVDAEPNGQRPDEQPGTKRTSWSAATRAPTSPRRTARTTTSAVTSASAPTPSCCCTRARGPNLLMSIPPDSLVPMPGHGTTKVNAAYAFGGPGLLVRALEDATGIRIDHYVEIGLGGFVERRRRRRRGSRSARRRP